jgi:hypothetical protein
MLASKQLTLDLVFVLLAAAVVLCVLAAGVVKQWTKSWMIPIGLACFAMATLVEWKW